LREQGIGWLQVPISQTRPAGHWSSAVHSTHLPNEQIRAFDGHFMQVAPQ
jgi:hypothetical protein